MREKIFVTKSSIPDISDYIKEIKSIFDSRWLTNMGTKHNELQDELKKYLGVRNIALTVNGHMAIEMALQVLGQKYNWVKNKSEIITTPFTFISTTHAIVRNNFIPRFADINDKTGCITAGAIEPLINKNTVAIMPVHVYGNVCNMKEIKNLADKYNLKIIYDASHTFGEKIDGKGVGSFGDVSTLSFHATKVFNTIEGGAVCFNDDTLDKKFYAIKNFGIKFQDPDTIESVGGNAKMNEFSAAMGLCNLREIDKNISLRSVVVMRYRQNLEDLKKVKILTCVADEYYKTISQNIKRNYAYMPVIFESSETRTRVMEALAHDDIFSRKYFYPLTSEAKSYEKYLWFGNDKTPIAKKISRVVLALPLYPDLPLRDVDRICKIIRGVCE